MSRSKNSTSNSSDTVIGVGTRERQTSGSCLGQVTRADSDTGIDQRAGTDVECSATCTNAYAAIGIEGKAGSGFERTAI